MTKAKDVRTARVNTRISLLLPLLAQAATACGLTEDPNSTPVSHPSTVATGPVPFSVDPNTCPRAAESSDGKLSPTYEAYLRSHADLTHSITVRLRELPWAEPCDGDTSNSSECAARDEVLLERSTLNQKEVECVYEAFGPPGSLEAPLPQWYEPSRKLSSGLPMPIGSAFSAVALWSQIEAVVSHPYVERVEPTFGLAATLGVAPPELRQECPAAMDEPMLKLTDAVSIQGHGRRPAVVQLRRELMPELPTCRSEGFCEELHRAGWELTIVGRRMLSCVQALIDTIVQVPAPAVAYGGTVGVPPGGSAYPFLPPFSDSIHATTAFGSALTWEEAVEIARHPYVSQVWTSDGLTTEPLPEGCPPQYDQPVATRMCPTGTEPIEGKINAKFGPEWQASAGAHEVLVAIRRSTPVCPRPACPGREVACPELERYLARLEEETLADQTCVRSLITSIGGMERVDVIPAGASVIAAALTWAQIQTVAAHPNVSSVDPAHSGTPPP